MDLPELGRYVRRPRRLAAWLVFLSLGIVFGPGTVEGFGKNKLKTLPMRWEIFETEHFEIFHYPEERTLARETCALAEEAYERGTRLLRYKPLEKTPLFIFRTAAEFQQTEILPGVIGTGVGGFTEAFKNRIALPAPASPRELSQVIRHEYAHALQYDILLGEGMRSFRVYKSLLVPTWITEGLAEYAADAWDTLDDMVLRDAVIHDRLLPLTVLDGFAHVEDVYLAYQTGHLAMRYFAQRYGEERLAAFFKKFKTQVSTSQILRETIGIGLPEFSRDFLSWTRQTYWVQTNGRQEPGQYGEPLWENPEGRAVNCSGPAWSPDGKTFAFISNRDHRPRIYLKHIDTPDQPRDAGMREFESISFRGRPLTWSPDGTRLAFSARAEGRTDLWIHTLSSGRTQRVALPVDDLYSPSWSPKGDSIILVGVRQGQADLYRWSLGDQTLVQLTQDRWADDAPCWGPGAAEVYYSSERGRYWQLAYLGLERAGSEPRLLTETPSNHLTPQVGADGRSLIFSGDLNGIYNLYRMNLPDQRLERLTDVKVGVFAPSLSPTGQDLTFVGFANGSRQIYWQRTQEKLAAVPVEPSSPTLTAAWTPPPVPEISGPVPYSFRFSPDLLFLLAGYDSTQGVVGGGYLIASDLLGEHQVTLQTQMVPGYQTQVLGNYGNYQFPVAVGVTGSYVQNNYRLVDLETGLLLDTFSDRQIVGGLTLSRAFSYYDRVESRLSVSDLRRDFSDAFFEQKVTSWQLSLVHDSIQFFDFEPAAGFRHRLSSTWADRFLGGESQYTLWQVNSQFYQSLDFVNPYLILGGRALFALSHGLNHPDLLFGGIGFLPESGTLRGYRYGDLLASQVAALNVELRFPLARLINYSFWPLDFLLLRNLQMVVYDDLGLVTHDLTRSSLDQWRNSVGIGFRAHTFLLGKELLTIRFDISKITHTAAETYYSWGLGQAF